MLVSNGFLTHFFKNSLASGDPPPPKPRRNVYFYDFLKFWPNFSKRFDRTFKSKVLKNWKFSFKIAKNWSLSLIFKIFFENLSGVRGAQSQEDPPSVDPLTSHLLLVLDSPQKIFPVGANAKMKIKKQIARLH